jgi:superfamily II DNA/RNA helicase
LQYVHRCGRAGRSQNLLATVYSFFTRELAPMAKDVLALLEFSNAWIDPNLLELVGRNDGPLKKKQRRQQQQTAADENLGDGLDANEGDEWDDGQFASLCANRIVLKRASHVSDASESESNEGSP